MAKRNTSNNPLKTSGYPIEIISNYMAGKITRQQFIKKFSDWQKSRGINYDCKGYADKSGVYIAYRGIVGKIKSGIIKFLVKTSGKDWVYINKNAKTVFEFCRLIDFSKCKECAKWN